MPYLLNGILLLLALGLPLLLGRLLPPPSLPVNPDRPLGTPPDDLWQRRTPRRG